MITFHSTNLDFDATLQGDDNGTGGAICYDRSKTMLRLERLDQQKLSIFGIVFNFTGGYTSVVYYYTDPNGILQLPLRNFLRRLKNEANVSITIALREVGGSSAVDLLTFSLDIMEGISYMDAFAPVNKDAPTLYWEREHHVVLPPNVIINPDHFSGVAGFGIIVESNYHGIDNNAVWSAGTGGVFATITPSGNRDNEIVVPYAADTLMIAAGKDNNEIKRWHLDKPSECADLVCVRWTSQTGAVRQHYFPIVSYIKGTDKAVSIVSAGDGYLVDKNQYNAVLCRLAGLTNYGYWYYMDLLQATDAHAIIQPTFLSFDDEMASEQTAVFIEADEMETPEGVGFFDFEFTIKLRHYGTL